MLIYTLDVIEVEDDVGLPDNAKHNAINKDFIVYLFRLSSYGFIDPFQFAYVNLLAFSDSNLVVTFFFKHLTNHDE